MFNPVVAVVLSVTFVLAFGEVIPQAICSRYGLAVGANLIWLVKVLMVLCFPIAYPVGKLLDHVLGHNDSALFRRAQLKALVSIHGKEAGKGGELTHDETTIISGALDLTEKIAEEAMTPIESTFSLDVNSKLDWEAMGKILARGHSRVPVYEGSHRNIIGLLLVKSLLTVRAEAETPVNAVSIRRIPRVPADMPLYDILNEFQKGSSHMAAVVKTKNKRKPKRSTLADALFPAGTEKKEGPHKHRQLQLEHDADLEKGQMEKNDEAHGNGAERSHDDLGAKAEQSEGHTDENGVHHRRSGSQTDGSGVDDVEEGEVIGIITLEDVIEELLQEEIVDETDEYVDVHKRIRVAAVAATMSRVGSIMNRDGVKVAGLSVGGSFRDRRDGSKVRFTNPEPPRDPTAAASRSKDDLRQPLLEASANQEQA
ncbi:metal transporter CNNM [Marchantia polymorpha subsp. ruderalis]|nr:hypothetical protein MARPO_0147s0037 [Marchantia polymorpha]BBN10301.1 hypothetical protein Mp_5g02440 [Marchantia polymorpha subsp. ruderalis]|eukprot:PTQ29161.1 hypothetical protein MARPO_0147s0037 [Marchantia polymorpha]